jgi:hypothetical protein
MHRRNKLRHRPRNGGTFWYPVENANLYEHGDVIFIVDGPSQGRHRVRVRGRGELLVEPLSWWNLAVRFYGGRLKRFWRRLWR